MDFDIEFEQEEDGRWIAEIPKMLARIAKHTGLMPDDL
jgi:hypothetical protein